jgi:hypothetical protein
MSFIWLKRVSGVNYGMKVLVLYKSGKVVCDNVEGVLTPIILIP